MRRLSTFLFALFFLCALPRAAPGQPLPYQPSPLMQVTGTGTVANDTPIAAFDCSRFRVVSVQLTGTWSGTVTWEVSNDGTTWVSTLLSLSTATTGATMATANGTYVGSINAHFFRARFSTATSGTVVATALFFTTSASAGGLGSSGGGSSGTVTGLAADSGGTTTGAVVTAAGGAGVTTVRSGDTVTWATASDEASFLKAGALTCGAATAGKIQVHTTPLQYCDNAATPTLRYAAYGDSAGNALTVATAGTNGQVLLGVTGSTPVAAYPVLSHATDCPTNVTGKINQLCVDLDDGKIWECQPTAGDCDTAAEWLLVIVPPRSPKNVILSEEFPLGSATNGAIGSLGWQFINVATGCVVARVAGETNHPGIWRVTASAGVSGGCAFTPTNAVTAHIFASVGSVANWDTTWVFRINQLVTMRYRLGFINDFLTVPPVSYIGLRYDTALSDTNFQFTCDNAGTGTVVSSGIAADTAFHTLRMRSVTAGTVLFSLDGGAESSIGTNCFTGAVSPTFQILNDAAIVTSTTDIDFFSLWMQVAR